MLPVRHSHDCNNGEDDLTRTDVVMLPGSVGHPFEVCDYEFKVKARAPLVAQWLRIHCQCRGHGFEPWSGKIPHATEQLSLCTTTTEPALYSPKTTTTHMLLLLEAHASRACAPQQEKPLQ